jgi:O-antigen/teichoic acid export membrane protein
MGVAIVLVRLLTKEQFGSYRQVMLVGMFLAGLLGMQLQQSLYYFVPKLGRDRRRSLLVQTLFLAAVGGVAAAAIMFFGARPLAQQFGNPSLTSLLTVFCVFPLLHIVLQIVPHFMISADRAARGCVYIIAREMVRAGVVVSVAAMGASVGSLLISLLVGTGVLALVGIADMYRLSPGRAMPVDRGLVRAQLAYVVPMAAAVMVGVTKKFFDKVLIGTFFNTEEFAVYVVGAIELPVSAVVTSSMFAAIMPNLVKQWDEGRTEQMLGLWRQAVRTTSIVVYPLFFAILICAQDLVLLMYGEAYREAAYPLMIYVFILPIRVAVYGAFLRAVGRTRPVFIGAALALVANVVFSVGILMAARQLLGEKALLAFLAPAIGTVLAAGCSAMYLIVAAGRAAGHGFRRIMPWGELARLLSIAALAGAAAYVAPVHGLPLVLRILVRGGGSVGLFLLLTAVSGTLKPDEMRMLTAPLRVLRRLSFNRKGG